MRVGIRQMENIAKASVQRIFSFVVGLATILVLSAGHPVQAQTLVDPNSRVSAVPGFAGTGLQGYYYSNANGEFSNFDQIIHDSIGPLSGATPSATFLTTNICYPNCANGSISDGSGGLAYFLNGNATDLSFNGTPRTTFNNSGVILNGFIAIDTIGSYTFHLQSDDASVLRLGDFTADRFSNIDLNFTATGLYQIAINFTEDGGGSNLSLTATSDSNAACFLGCSDGNGGLTNTGLFYSQGQLDSAPAPTIGGGASSLALLGLLGVGALVRRRRQGEVL
jgi:MYXO-CTERM domain-containing protein